MSESIVQAFRRTVGGRGGDREEEEEGKKEGE